MYYTLSPSEFKKVHDLFAPLTFQLFCSAVLAGKQAGEIYVDHPKNPHTAFMITRGSWVFLAGSPDNDAFIQAVNTAIHKKTIVKADTFGLLISLTPDLWAAKPDPNALNRLMAPIRPIPNLRRHYAFRSINYNWAVHTPAGYSLQFIDESIRDLPGLDQDVVNLLDTRAESRGPEHAGFGFIAVYEHQAVAHAVIDCVVGTTGDIGLVTQPSHRRRGLAAATAAAAIAYGLSHGLAQIDWDCSIDNIGSVRTAEKLDGQPLLEHYLYYADFNPTWHAVGWMRYHIRQNHFEKALIQYHELAAQQTEIPPFAHVLSAEAWAGLRNTAHTIQALNTAVDSGFRSRSYLEAAQLLKPLHTSPEWQKIISKLETPVS